MKTKADISVIIPSFDRQGQTEHAINSVQCSEPQRVEVVVVDDGSKQRFHYIGPYSPQGVRVRVQYVDQNSGPSVAREIGVRAAHASTIIFLDSDDRLAPGWLNQVMQALEGTPKGMQNMMMVGSVEGASLVVRSIEALLERMSPRWHLAMLRQCFMFSNVFHTSGLVLSKQACVFNGGRYCEDYYTNALAIYKVDRVLIVQTPACELNRRQGIAGGISAAKWQMAKGEMSVRKELLFTKDVPIPYRMLIPFGFLYQCVRDLVMEAGRYLSRTILKNA